MWKCGSASSAQKSYAYFYRVLLVSAKELQSFFLLAFLAICNVPLPVKSYPTQCFCRWRGSGGLYSKRTFKATGKTGGLRHPISWEGFAYNALESSLNTI